MRIRWTPAAAADLEYISNYLKDHHPHYQQPTIRKLYEAICSLKALPHRGRIGREQGTRSFSSLPCPISPCIASESRASKSCGSITPHRTGLRTAPPRFKEGAPSARGPRTPCALTETPRRSCRAHTSRDDVWSARRSLADLVSCKELTLSITHSTGSRASVKGWSNPPHEAWGGERVSRSASEPDSASLCKVRAAKLPDVMKPATGGEARGASNHRALRGGWGRRMGKDQWRNPSRSSGQALGDPAGWPMRVGQRSRGIDNPGAARSGSRTGA